MNLFGLFLAALALDLALGDPAWAWHPVRLIGQLIKAMEKIARRRPGRLRLRGVGLALFVVGLTWMAGLAWQHASGWLDLRLNLDGWLYIAGSVLLLKSSFAVRDLIKHAWVVQKELEAGDLIRARIAVGRMVGRDVTTLDERGVRRACLESVAESLGDGVVAPLLFAALGGPALALAYRALNTLDSMVGYKDERYLELGWASARLDDAANWIPARIAAALSALAAFALGLDGRAAWKTAWTDGPKQPSPNAGWPEGAFAGALGVQLGGPLQYRGRTSNKPSLGEALKPLDIEASRMSLKLYALASLLAVLLAAGLSVALHAEAIEARDLTYSAQDGTRLAATWAAGTPSKARPLILLVPGFGQWYGTRTMRYVSSLLTPTADVLCLAMRGNGPSGGRYQFGAEEAPDVVAALKAIPAPRGPLVVLGLSLGAYISVRAVAEYGLKPSRLLLVSCPTKLESIVSSGGAFLNPLVLPFQKASLAVPQEADFFFRWGALFSDKPSAADLAPKLACPTAFLVGSRDRLVFPRLSKQVFDAVKAPKTYDAWADGLHAETMALQHPKEFQAWVAQALR